MNFPTCQSRANRDPFPVVLLLKEVKKKHINAKVLDSFENSVVHTQIMEAITLMNIVFSANLGWDIP